MVIVLGILFVIAFALYIVILMSNKMAVLVDETRKRIIPKARAEGIEWALEHYDELMKERSNDKNL